MIADRETNIVYVADVLKRQFPAVYKNLASILRKYAIPLRVIPKTRQVWCRDYMPVQVAENRFVQFRYEPDYLAGRYEHLRADGEVGPKLPGLTECSRSGIVLDGGNIVGRGNRAIMTDKVFRENPGSSRTALVAALEKELRLTELIVIPQEPDDPIGHSDGMVTWLDDHSVLMNDYSTISESFRRRIRQILGQYQIDLMELPYHPQPGVRDGIPTAAGNWINFLCIRDLVILPVFGMVGDEKAMGILRDVHAGYAVEAIECRKLAEEGGLIHCVTWQG